MTGHDQWMGPYRKQNLATQAEPSPKGGSGWGRATVGNGYQDPIYRKC